MATVKKFSTKLGAKVRFQTRFGTYTGKVSDHRHLQNGKWIDVDINVTRKGNPHIITVRPSQILGAA